MKNLIKNFANKFGYDIVKAPKNNIGRNAYLDMNLFFQNNQPVVFDIGANTGQTINLLKYYYPHCKILSFEPSPSTFEILKNNSASELPNVDVFNLGIGSFNGKLSLFENSNSDMSSFLPLSSSGWGTIKSETFVEIKTIDWICQEKGIQKIDLLKSDTQGFELEVFKGAEKSIKEGRIGLIFLEVIFSDMYKNLPSLSEINEFLIQRDFLMVSMYDIYYQNKVASWADLLYVHKSYLK